MIPLKSLYELSGKHIGWMTTGLIALALLFCFFAPRSMTFTPALTGLILTGILVFCTRQKIILPRSEFYWVIAIAALCAATSFWSINPGESLERTGKVAAVLLTSLLMLTAVRSIPVDQYRSHLWLLPLALASIATLILFEYLSDFTFFRILRGGISHSQYISPTEFNRTHVISVMCFFPIMFAIQTLPVRRRLQIAASAGLVLIMILSLLQTKSQSAQLAFLMGAGFLILFPVQKPKAWLGLAATIAILTLSAPWIVRNLFGYVISISPRSILYEASVPHRFEIWNFAADKMAEKPLLGYGMGTTRFLHSDTYMEFAKTTSVIHPHSAVFEIWLELGLPGIFLAFGFTAFVLIRIYLLPDPARRYALACFICALTVSAIGYGFWQSWWLGLLFFMAGLQILAQRAFSKYPKGS